MVVKAFTVFAGLEEEVQYGGQLLLVCPPPAWHLFITLFLLCVCVFVCFVCTACCSLALLTSASQKWLIVKQY